MSMAERSSSSAGLRKASSIAFPDFIDELVASHVDVIITSGYSAALAAKEHAGNVPIVVTLSGDPAATGLVASLAHPGGNITGVAEIAAKQLAVLKEAVPSVRNVAVLWNTDDFGMTWVTGPPKRKRTD
jgi:putative tryptophan/tyrosine transport system substrate-binding protein